MHTHIRTYTGQGSNSDHFFGRNKDKTVNTWEVKQTKNNRGSDNQPRNKRRTNRLFVHDWLRVGGYYGR